MLSDDVCFAMWTRELPKGSAMILPIAHRKTPFDLTDAEWRSTKALLGEMRRLIQQHANPDGWNVGWNVEPLADRPFLTPTVTSFRATDRSYTQVAEFAGGSSNLGTSGTGSKAFPSASSARSRSRAMRS